MASDIYTQSDFLMIKTACMYYLENMQQQQISEKLNISVTTVSRLLKRAKEEKVIKYVIEDKYMHCIQLAGQLRNRYGLEEVIVAYDRGENIPTGKKRKMVALEAARYLQRIIQKNDVLGISWGRIVCNMMLYLNPSHKVDSTFVTLHGKLGNCISEDVESLVKKMAKAFSGNNYYLKSEALMPDVAQADAVRRQPDTRKVYDMFDKINLSITGVGAWAPEKKSILAEYGVLSEEEQALLETYGVVGDLGLRFFNEKGEPCDGELGNRLIAISLEQFKRIERKITVAAGLEKTYTLDCALRGGLIDVLILDEELAEALLRISSSFSRDTALTE